MAFSTTLANIGRSVDLSRPAIQPEGEFSENQWRLMKITKDWCILLKIKGYQWRLVKISKDYWWFAKLDGF